KTDKNVRKRESARRLTKTRDSGPKRAEAGENARTLAEKRERWRKSANAGQDARRLVETRGGWPKRANTGRNVWTAERGFLTSNSKVKKNVDESMSSNDSVLGDLAKNGLAVKIKHINRNGVSNVRKAVRGVQFHTWAATSEPANTRSDQGLVHAENVPVRRQPLKSILKKTNVTNDISRSLNEGGTIGQVNADGPGNDTSVEPVTDMDSGIGGKKDVNAWNTPLIKPLFLMLTILVARLNKKRIKIMKLRNDEVVKGATVAIPLVAVEEAKYGLERVMLQNGFFLFQFSTREGMERVLENGMWLIRLVPLILNVWSPNTIMKKDEITMAPAWVKLHNVPIVAYSEAGLSLGNDTSVEPVTDMDSGIGGKKDVNAWNTPLIKPLFLMLTILVARLNKKRIKIMKLRNDEVVKGATVAIPLVAVEEVRIKFTNTLFGYFIGKHIGFMLVEKYVKNT
nr:hypothetical protein [Tanacetum cinerariifolium]